MPGIDLVPQEAKIFLAFACQINCGQPHVRLHEARVVADGLLDLGIRTAGGIGVVLPGPS